jgi:hypothetical protein
MERESWNDGRTKAAIVDVVERVTTCRWTKQVAYRGGTRNGMPEPKVVRMEVSYDGGGLGKGETALDRLISPDERMKIVMTCR